MIIDDVYVDLDSIYIIFRDEDSKIEIRMDINEYRKFKIKLQEMEDKYIIFDDIKNEKTNIIGDTYFPCNACEGQIFNCPQCDWKEGVK